MRQKPLSRALLGQVQDHLRRALESPRLILQTPKPGQTVQVLCGDEMVGTLDQDEDGDLVVTLPVLRAELPGG